VALYLNAYNGDGYLLEEEQAGDRSVPVTLTPEAESVIAYLIRIESFKVSDALGQLCAYRPDPPPAADHTVHTSSADASPPGTPW
jgi:hypothetical protein